MADQSIASAAFVISDTPEPITYEEAINGSEAPHWKKAITDKFNSIRALLAIGNQLNLEIHQMDVKTAFLNGELEEEIYMKVPDGINAKNGEVCKLHRSIYGLKQSPRMWNRKIDEFLISKQQFKRLNADHGIYIHRNGDKLAIIALYVDDLLILTSNISTMEKLKLELSHAFEMTDCGEAHHFLGIKINRSQGNLTIDQCHYIDQILCKFGMKECKSVITPLIKLNSLDDHERDDARDAERDDAERDNMRDDKRDDARDI